MNWLAAWGSASGRLQPKSERRGQPGPAPEPALSGRAGKVRCEAAAASARVSSRALAATRRRRPSAGSRRTP
uniref:Uncharacterized protein n=1 Tax=Arundo donax TaxID=35708 RepID=A0A0A9D790_ARUDO